jgi:hypothetical protein
MKNLIALLMVPAFVCCNSKTKADPLLPGGGEHKIRQIVILSKRNQTMVKENNPVTVSVGARLPLRVTASWAIPSVEDVTDKVKFTVNNPAGGSVSRQGIFVAKAPGKIVIDAELRVADNGSHRVLAPKEAAGGDPVISFHDKMEIMVFR